MIIVAPYKQLVDVAGKVKRPMVYEMKEGETVQNLIDYSGGFAGDAYKSNLRLIRRNGVEYQVYTVDSEDFGAFTRNAEGKYVIDFAKAAEAVDAWASLILETQATGNLEFAQKYSSENASIRESLASDIEKVNGAGIPRDIVFKWIW